MSELNPTLMFVLQGVLAVLMLFFGFILNGLRTSVERVSLELKILNDAVLGKYITRDDSDSRWKDQRILDHELRSMITTVMVEIAKIKGTPYDHGAKP